MAEAPAQDTSGTGPYALARTHFGYEIQSRSTTQVPPVVRLRLGTDQLGSGVYEVQAICNLSDSKRCAYAELEFPADPATGARPRYIMVAGMVNITSGNARRVRATFSGTAQLNVASEIQVRNGEFDLPILSP